MRPDLKVLVLYEGLPPKALGEPIRDQVEERRIELVIVPQYV
jgi:hypothetical protein